MMSDLSESDQLKILEDFAKKLMDGMMDDPFQLPVNVEELFA
jgi:hypothetical protein